MATTFQQNKTTKPKKKRSAADSAAGYDYQFERMLWHLATSSPGTLVGIETDDDVSLTKNGVTTLEQDKFVRKAKTNPFGNKSENLWKTLQIWIEHVTQTPGGNFRFLFATNSEVKRKEDSLIWMISDAEDEETVKNCVMTLRNTQSSDKAILQIMDSVKGAADAILETVIKNAKIVEGAKMDDAVLVEALEFPTGIDEAMLLNVMRGWIRSIVMNKWATGEPGIVSRQQFIDAKGRYCEKQKKIKRIERPWREILVSEVDKWNCISKTFVEQILAINMPEEIASDEIEHAIEDYIRFSTENSRLLNEGEITNGEWGTFFDALKNRWRNIRNRNMSVIQNNSSREELGRKIYFETLSDNHKEFLAGQQTSESYLTHGGYHCLADVESVRWHPDYPNI